MVALGNYMAALEATGLAITSLREPVPDETLQELVVEVAKRE
jgi:dihydroxyacetone kinase